MTWIYNMWVGISGEEYLGLKIPGLVNLDRKYLEAQYLTKNTWLGNS